MYTENLGRYNRRDGQAAEDVYKCSPNLDATPSFTLIIETVYWMTKRVVLATHIGSPNAGSKWEARTTYLS